jgi:adenylate cyclase
MSEDEGGTLAALKSHRAELFDPLVAKHDGRIVKLMGDGALVEFTSVVNAVECAMAIQSALAGCDAGIRLRIGINLGDVIIEGDDIYGDGVNVAARLEQMAEADCVLVSDDVYRHSKGRVDARFADLGEQQFKNIEQPVRVWRWQPEDRPQDGKANAHSPGEPQSLPDKPSIVVLPFDNLNNDPEQEYFADGIVEALTAALARVKSFFVIARNSAFVYKGRQFDLRDVGRELGVRYALEGSVQRAGQKVRITAQLIETLNGAHVWAERFDGTLDDIFELQDRITEQVAGALQPSIQLAEIERTARKRPQEFGAYDFTMQALPLCWQLEKEQTQTALGFLEKALEIDPRYPLALSLSAWCYAQQSVYNWTEDVVGAKNRALRMAEEAAHQSADDPLVLTVLGTAHTVVRNYSTGRILLERAVSIDPNASWAWSRLGWLEAYDDNCEAAITHFDRARRLSPFDPMTFNTYVGMASAYEGAGNYEKAISFYERALQERPQAMWIYRSYVSGLVGAGRMDDAKAAYAKLMQAYPSLTATKVREAMVFSKPFMDRMVANLKSVGLPD